MDLAGTKIHHFKEYTPSKRFNSFLQLAVDARSQGDENPHSSVVAETMKLLANGSCGYRIVNRSRHTLTKYSNDEKTHAANNNKLFKDVNHLNNSLYDVELAKSQIEHKKLIMIGFFILQCAKNQLLQLDYNFFTQSCDLNKFEELEKATDCLCLFCREGTGKLYPTRNESRVGAPAFEGLHQLFHGSCSRNFPSLEGVATSTKNLIRENLDSSKKNLDAQRCCVYVAKLTAVTILPQTNFY